MTNVCWPTKVILGGGRMYMTPRGTLDPEYPTSNSRKGDRNDKRNLIDVWLKAEPVRTQRARLSSNHLKSDFYTSVSLVLQNKRSRYVWNKREFDEINIKTTDRLMGG